MDSKELLSGNVRTTCFHRSYKCRQIVLQHIYIVHQLKLYYPAGRWTLSNFIKVWKCLQQLKWQQQTMNIATITFSVTTTTWQLPRLPLCLCRWQSETKHKQKKLFQHVYNHVMAECFTFDSRFIYIGPNHNNSLFKVLYFVRKPYQ